MMAGGASLVDRSKIGFTGESLADLSKSLKQEMAEGASTVCPSEESASQFIESLSDPENARIAQDCLRDVGHDGDTTDAFLKTSFNCNTAVLDQIRTQKESEEDVFSMYGQEADVHRQNSAIISEKLALFAEGVMRANGNVQAVISESKMGLICLKKLKEESLKGAAADKTTLADLAVQTVDHLQKGNMTDDIAKELETLGSSANELMEMAACAQQQLQEFIDQKESEMKEKQAQSERDFLAQKEECERAIAQAQQSVDTLGKEQKDAQAAVVEAKKEMKRLKDEADKAQAEHERDMREARRKQEEMNTMKQNAKRTSGFAVGLCVFGAVCLGVATLASGGAAAPAFAAYTSWVAGHLAVVATASALANASYLVAQEAMIAYKDRSGPNLDAARRKQSEKRELLRRAEIQQKEVEEQLSLKTAEFQQQQEALMRVQKEEGEKMAKIRAEFEAQQAQASEVMQKFQAVHALAERYKMFVDQMKEAGFEQTCFSMISTLKNLGVTQTQVSDFAKMPRDNVELVQDLARETCVPTLDAVILSLSELERMNTQLLVKAQKVYNTYHGVGADTVMDGLQTVFTTAKVDDETQQVVTRWCVDNGAAELSELLDNFDVMATDTALKKVLKPRLLKALQAAMGQ